MFEYAIIETDDGLTIIELEPGEAPEEAAAERGGFVVDPGPYGSYEDAYDALVTLQDDDDEIWAS